MAIRAGTKHRAPHRAYRNINSRLNSSVPGRAEPGVTNGPRSSVRRAAAANMPCVVMSIAVIIVDMCNLEALAVELSARGLVAHRM